MSYNDFQSFYEEQCGLTSQDLEFIKQRLPDPKYFDFISNHLKYLPDEHNFFISSYNNIKDDSWPVCHTRDDLKKLPSYIIDECKNVHGFDFLIYEKNSISEQEWTEFKSGDYPTSELVRYNEIILKLEKYLKNKKIVDLACHAGLTSLMCLHVGASWVTATNIRSEFVDLANKVLKLSPHGNKFNAVTADIHDYKTNSRLCKDADTVLLYGIMYHVHDHCEIIDSVLTNRPKNLIIDTFIPNDIINNRTPLMQWGTEDSESVWCGWHNNQQTVPIGAANNAWFDLYLATKNYQLVYEQKYFSAGVGFLDIGSEQRSVMVFESAS